MSYSFVARGKTKVEAIQAAHIEMEKVVKSQPIHEVDSGQALVTVGQFVDVLPDDAEKDVSVSVSGSLGWNGSYPDSHVLSSAQVSVYASLVKREEKVAA